MRSMNAQRLASKCLTLTRVNTIFYLICFLLLISLIFSLKGPVHVASPLGRLNERSNQTSSGSKDVSQDQLRNTSNSATYEMSVPRPRPPAQQNTSSQPELILFKPNNWTRLKCGGRSDDNLFFYSAYYETRFDIHAVKVFGYQRNVPLPPDFGCRLSGANNKSSYSTGRIMYPNKYLSRAKKHLPCVIICNISHANNITEYPSMVSVHSKETGEYSAPLLIQHVPPNDLRTKYDFTVCVQPVREFGETEMHIKEFIEFIEESVFFGASRIVLYAQSIFPNPAYLHLMNYYEKEGILEIHNYTLPVEDVCDFSKRGQTVALMDCFYRHMWDSQYVVTYDMDEIIVPMKHENWSQLVSYLASQPGRESCDTFSDINVQNAFFNRSTCVKQTDVLGSLGDRMTCTLRDGYTFDHNVRSKYFANPRIVLYPGVHWILMDGPPELIQEKCAKIQASSEDALLFHYRRYFKAKGTPSTENRMLHFKEAVMKRFDLKRKIFQDILYP